MSILGKRYTYKKNGKSYEDSTFKHVTKTILGLGVTGAFSYLAYKYGYGEVSSLFNHIDVIKNGLSDNDAKISNNLLGFFTLGTIFGLVFGGIAEAAVSDEKCRDFSALKYFRNASIFPVVASGIVLFHEPHAIEIALNAAHIAANFLGGAALAVVSTTVLISPLFSKKLVDVSETMARQIPAFSHLTQKMNDYFEKIHQDKLIKQNRKTLANSSAMSHIDEKQNDKSGQSVEGTILTEMNKTHQALHQILLLAKNKYNLQYENTTYSPTQKLHEIYLKSEYIVKHSSLETLAYRQEVLSLYGNILPQIINSYEASLDNTTLEEKQNNSQKLISGLVKIDAHFGRLENVIREQNKTKKNMDFDEALQFAHSRFDLPENGIEATKKMVMKG